MKTIAVIFGGRSTEHDISIITALSTIIPALERSGKYLVEPVYISKSGTWHLGAALKQIALYQSGKIEDYIKDNKPAQIMFKEGMVLSQPTKIGKKNLSVHVGIAFPALHGTNGEDGALMGLLEMAGIPYVGCDVAASSVSMNKVLAKQITGSVGILSTPWATIDAHDLNDKKLVQNKLQHLEYPIFVKPAHLGSSIGISKVIKKEQLHNALEVAAYYDNLIIVEQAVDNLIEVTLPIIGNETPIPSLLEQPLAQSDGFFDFDKKYINQGGKKNSNKGSQGYSTIPAKLPKKLYNEAEAMALNVYKAVNCSGIARVDMLIDSKTQVVYFNEINPMPGSLYAHNWRVKGVSTVDLVDKLVTYAEQRHKRTERLNTTFSTNFLKQF